MNTVAQQQTRTRRRPQVDVEDLLPLYQTGGDAYLGYRIVLAGRLFDRRIIEILQEHGPMTLPQWRMVSQLGLLPQGTVRSLADGAAVDRAEVSRELGKLEKEGLVKRKINPDDQRSPLFSLTPAGRRCFRKMRQPISRFIQELVEGVSEKDLRAANRVLWQVTQGAIAAAPD